MIRLLLDIDWGEVVAGILIIFIFVLIISFFALAALSLIEEFGPTVYIAFVPAVAALLYKVYKEVTT